MKHGTTCACRMVSDNKQDPSPSTPTPACSECAADCTGDAFVPVTLTLKRGAGYFRAETYTVLLTKEGFADKELTIVGTVSGWYIGNILIGGLIGMLAIDPITGGMYTFPDSVNGTLEPQAAKTSSAAPTLTIVSTDSLTPEQMKGARLLLAGR